MIRIHQSSVATGNGFRPGHNWAVIDVGRSIEIASEECRFGTVDKGCGDSKEFVQPGHTSGVLAIEDLVDTDAADQLVRPVGSVVQMPAEKMDALVRSDLDRCADTAVRTGGRLADPIDNR